MDENNDTLWTAEETAAYLKVTVGTVNQWAKVGKIPVTKVGTLNRFRKSDLDKWLDESSRVATVVKES